MQSVAEEDCHVALTPEVGHWGPRGWLCSHQRLWSWAGLPFVFDFPFASFFWLAASMLFILGGRWDPSLDSIL